MCPSKDDYNRLIINSKGKTFTLMEAFDFMKGLPTGQNIMSWKNTKTGSSVNIGYNK
jgi:hypothetical protein